jgi:hypothetical protein
MPYWPHFPDVFAIIPHITKDLWRDNMAGLRKNKNVTTPFWGINQQVITVKVWINR